MPTQESNMCEAAAASGAKGDLQQAAVIGQEIARRRAQDALDIAKLDWHYQGVGPSLSSDEVQRLHKALNDSSAWYKKELDMLARLKTGNA